MKQKISLSIVTFISLMLLNSVVFSQNTTELSVSKEEKFEIEWNTSKYSNYKQNIEGNFGVADFAVIDSTKIAYLNETNNMVSLYTNNIESGNFKSGISPSFGIDFINKKYYIFGLYECAIHNKKGELEQIIHLPNEIKVVERLINVGNKVFILSSDQKSYRITTNGLIKTKAYPLTNELSAKIVKNNSNSFNIVFFKNQNQQKSVKIPVDKQLASAKLIGANSGYIFIDAEYIKQEKPLITERELIVYDLSKEANAIVNKSVLPNANYLALTNDFKITNNSLYYFLPLERSGKVYQINFKNTKTNNNISLFSEDFVPKPIHYNLNKVKTVKTLKNEKIVLEDSIVDPILREKIIENAEAFETMEWTAKSSNIQDGVWCDNQNVYSAPWVVVGTNRSMPYMWDGFSSIEKYNLGMANNLAAGNTNTLTNIGSMNCAEGVDCSGYVSQTWETEWKYDTREFEPVIIEYNSWDELKPGDIANKPGHIRMLHSLNENGTMLMLEATSRDNVWRVIYNLYTVSDMQYAYKPYYLYSVYEENTQINSLAKESAKLNLFPNPASNELNIERNQNQDLMNAKYSIFDLNGKRILNGNYNNQAIKINSLEKGIYILKIRNQSNIYLNKFSKN